ncbi:hypothetical protein C5167_037232 [Papaver somniferum]|uniref:Uncharacterized protein n=1 Tax=Papaver somniferum TaxID=3469 RepID=A0A4Y7I9V5_PAPSO|nr:hypothetical protein C5167_037232 [Papaver somniferum]
MMLRSSSTPLLGSLLSSYSESPNHRDYETHNPNSEVLKKISFTHGGNSINFSSYSTCNNASSLTRSISGVSDSSDTSSSNGFRRAQSDGNLKGLAAASSDMEDQDLFSQFSSNNNPFKSSKRTTSMLQSIPSFSVYNSNGGFEDDDEEDYEDEKDGSLQRSVTIGENIMSMGSGEFTFGGEKMGLIQENDEDNQFNEFQYSKGDLWGADEYYSRAVLADPRDGDILAQYARLVWELHHDYERASSYFERAVQAAPEGSHVHAAYASFLWETEDCDEEEDQQSSLSHNFVGVANFHGGALTSATA